MFPSRYFAARYFAPRYWPEIGAAAAIVVVNARILAQKLLVGNIRDSGTLRVANVRDASTLSITNLDDAQSVVL